jgi:hypothetical protein
MPSSQPAEAAKRPRERPAENEGLFFSESRVVVLLSK